MAGRLERICQVCGSGVGFTISDDGFFYCGYCNTQADDVIDTGVDEEQIVNHYSANHCRVRPANIGTSEPISQVKFAPSQLLDHHILEEDVEVDMGDGVGPTKPSDFGTWQNNFTYDDYYSAIRSRYLTGLQVMIQLQCQALVEKFNVSPLIVGLVGPIWLRFLASTSIMSDEWADKVIHDSETQIQGEIEEFQPSAKYRTEPVNILGKRVVTIWYRSIKRTVPIYYSIAISFLVCHVAQEAILPTDMLKWTLEGKLPYFSAFSEIGKQLGSHSKACPISVSRMFRPIQAVSSQKLESMAADIAQKIGLELPSVNFHAIASRYCRKLSLPSKEILPLACKICEWCKPPELYLSTNEFRIPSRVYVMSILTVAIRILFDINGFGIWESSLSNPSSLSHGGKDEEMKSRCQSDITNNGDMNSPSSNSETCHVNSDVLDSRLDVRELLKILEANYRELDDGYVYSRDLFSYLKYCKDVVFTGLQPSFEDLEDEKLLEEFWDLYQGNKGTGKSDDHLHDDQNSANRVHPSTDSWRDGQIRQLKLEMEENRFCYIQPRVKVKSKDYIHYARKRKEVYVYAVHADYYILLRSCAKIAQVETRIMHLASLSFERRLKWLEKRIGYTLRLRPNLNDVCDFCCNEPVQNGSDDSIELNI